MRAYLAPLALVLTLGFVPVQGAFGAPITFGVQSGSVTLSPSLGGSLAGDPVTLALDGSQLTLDATANELTSLDLTASGPIDVALDMTYGGFDTLTIQSFRLSGGPGTLSLVDAGPPQEHFFSIDPAQLEVAASFSSSVGGASQPGQTFTSSSVASGTLFLSDADGVVSLDGIAFAEIGPTAGEDIPILLKSDFRATGSSAQPAVPEPTAALAFAVGLAAVAGAVHRSRQRA